MAKLTLLIILSFVLTGCTENERARSLGGTMTIDLPAGQKLINATWKETQLWYLTRPSKNDEKPEVLTFKESSSYGVMEGKVVFREH